MMFENLQLKAPVTPEDRDTLLTYYRRLRRRADQASSDAIAQIEVLRNLFGLKFFIDVDMERNPCSHRVKIGEGYYCRLAQQHMEQLGRKSGYDTSCNCTSHPCNDPLKIEHDRKIQNSIN